MVMEAATLSGPQRKYNVVPVQKSLSLPSYARAGGEGIDHRLIFAALEQKEKVRRKSRIFAREKTARQNLFCLPISTGSKCRETSLSSDTSCSSLEYQKPKPVSKAKKEDSKETSKKPIENEPPSEKTIKTSQLESKTNVVHLRKDVLTRDLANGDLERDHSLKVNDSRKGHRSPVDTFRLNVGSSDSMERSSRSSNDSLTRKERLVAIKARVEAEREKYGNSSSEEEIRSNMTRYNSDGVIHRTVREVKSRSYRNDKRLRRMSQDEWAIKKANRKNNLSLCLNPDDDGIKLHLEKLDRMNNEINNLEVKTDYCPSPNFPDMTKKNYFSDFPSRENVTRFVQQRIKLIEEEERKRRSGSDFYDKMKSSQLSALSQEKLAYNSTEHINSFEKKTTSGNLPSDIRCASTEFVRRTSPIPRSSQAPTPPPRSPKSITFVNKAFLQHQNATLIHQENSLDKKKLFQPNITAVTQTRPDDKTNIKMEIITRNPKNPWELQGSPNEKQLIRELFNSRRKTCGNFDFVDEKVLNDLCSTQKIEGTTNSPINNNHSSSLTQIKNIDGKGYVSSIETPSLTAAEDKNKSWLNKWDENERKREFMFNSLENKKKSTPLSWAKWKIPSENSDTCICFLVPENQICKCKSHVETNKSIKTEKNSNHTTVQDNKDVFNDPFYAKWKISTKANDTCTCYLKTKNRSVCNCKNLELKSNTFEIQSTGLRNHFDASTNGNKLSQRLNPPRLDVSISKQNTSQIINRFNGKATAYDSNDDLQSSKDDFKTDNSATANLESAMAELESVYLSLKFSSDNLSDRNSLSNISLSDEDSKLFTKNNDNISISKESYNKRSSMHESNTHFDVLNSADKKDVNQSKLLKDYLKPSSINSTKDLSESTNAFYKNSSFNDLFKDLTPQFNTLEEKIDLHFNRDQPISCHESNKFDNKPHTNTSSFGNKKEFYENLQNHQGILQKKKLKAVRSLSENISQLMNSPNNNCKAITKHSPESNIQAINNLSKTTSANSSLSDCYKPASLDLWKNEPKRNLSNSPKLQNKMNGFEKPPIQKHEEIRQIRVSMDSAASKSAPTSLNTQSDTSQYPRLTSAICLPQMSPRCEFSKPFQTMASSNSKENIDTTIDGLEELLHSLLGDSPERNQSSLPTVNDAITTSPQSVPTGEMRVLQHLDAIRLKPVPS